MIATCFAKPLLGLSATAISFDVSSIFSETGMLDKVIFEFEHQADAKTFNDWLSDRGW